IICKPRSKGMRLGSRVIGGNGRRGANLKTKLSNGRSSLDFSGRVVRDEGPDAVSLFEARVPASSELFDFLKTGSTLTIEAGSARRTVPLRDILQPPATWMRACLNRRRAGVPLPKDRGRAILLRQTSRQTQGRSKC